MTELAVIEQSVSEIKTSDVEFVKELYPRIKPDDATIERYRDAIENLPPIVLARGRILVDGYHRWQAHSREKIETVKPVYEAYQEFFKNEYDEYDNLDFYRNELGELGQCNKSIERTLENLDIWKNELTLTLKQLTDLKHDYQNGLMEAGELQTYLNNELFATFQINKNIQKNIGVVSNCLGNFKALTDVLDSVRLEWIDANTSNE